MALKSTSFKKKAKEEEKKDVVIETKTHDKNVVVSREEGYDVIREPDGKLFIRNHKKKE